MNLPVSNALHVLRFFIHNGKRQNNIINMHLIVFNQYRLKVLDPAGAPVTRPCTINQTQDSRRVFTRIHHPLTAPYSAKTFPTKSLGMFELISSWCLYSIDLFTVVFTGNADDLTTAMTRITGILVNAGWFGCRCDPESRAGAAPERGTSEGLTYFVNIFYLSKGKL